tara:strand:- start:398 stop:517 length:120 start_codon:yes stop_codon:yes gene_type:complete
MLVQVDSLVEEMVVVDLDGVVVVVDSQDFLKDQLLLVMQ